MAWGCGRWIGRSYEGRLGSCYSEKMSVTTWLNCMHSAPLGSDAGAAWNGRIRPAMVGGEAAAEPVSYASGGLADSADEFWWHRSVDGSVPVLYMSHVPI